MSKQVKIMLTGLMVLFMISATLNIIQYGSSNQKGSVSVIDSTAIWRDSVAQKSDSINKLKNDLKNIGTEVDKISRNNLSPIDSIQRIIKKNNK